MAPDALPDPLRETLAAVDPGTPSTTTEVADCLDVGRRSTHDRLSRLADRGHVQTKKVGASGRVWWRTQKTDRLGATPSGTDDVYSRITDAFFALDEEWRFTHLNEQAERVLERDADDLRGSVVWEEFPAAVGSRFQREYERAMATQETVTFEAFYPPLDSWLEVHAYPSETGLSVYFRNVTERRERKQELERYEGIFETAGDIIYVIDDEQRFADINRAVTEVTGYEREEVLGAPVSAVVGEESAARALELAEELDAGDHEVVTREFSVPTKSGSEVRLEAQFTRLPTDGGTELVGVARDITERVERERELERYRAVVETAGDGVYAVDSEGHFTMVNEAYAEMAGRSRSDLLGAHVSVVVDEETAETAQVLERDLVTGERDTVKYEAELGNEAGTRHAEATFSILPDGDGNYERVAVVRDVTERVERERELEQYETVAEATSDVIVTIDTENTIWTVNHAVDDVLGYAPEELRGESLTALMPERLRERHSDALQRYLDTGERTLDWDYLELPGRHADGHEVPLAISFSEYEHEGERFFAGILRDITERKERERELERQRERLAALDALNGVFRDVTEAVIERSTREEVESIVCERLAASDAYQFAWVGDVDVQAQTVTLRTATDLDGTVPDAALSVDPDDAQHADPAVRAVREREVQATRGGLSDATERLLGDAVGEGDLRSSAAIPILSEETLYGVLCVYSERPNAFDDDELSVVGQLGEVVGHAIAAVERKRALTSDEVVEFEFQIRDVFEAVDLSVSVDGTITLDRAIPVGDDAFLEYGTATGNAMTAIEELVASDTVPHWESVTALDTDGEETRFELRLAEPPVLSLIADHGGSVQEARIEDGDYYMRIHLAPSTDVRRVVDAIQETYPSIELLTQRQVRRERPSSAQFAGNVLGDLTDHQQSAIEAAYSRGYFGWPRDTSGEEVAASMDISPPTFHQHLRKAEKKIFDVLFDEGGLHARRRVEQ